jgi:HK97 gp10 family phage protein
MPNGNLSWTVSGLKELDNRLRDIPTKLQAKGLRSAVSAGARVIRDDARARVHPKSGALRQAIRFTTSVKSGIGQATAKLFVSQKKAWYGRLVEFGTLPHLIVGGKLARSRNWYTRVGVFGSPNQKKNRFQVRTVTKQLDAMRILGNFVEKVDHPGARPKPFMEPAANSKYAAAVDAMVAKLRAFLDTTSPS